MTPQILWTLDYLVERYKHHQRHIRGLRDKTLQDYERFVRPFVRLALGEDPVNPAHLSPSNVVAFISSRSERLSPRSMKHVRTALRSFFRFLRFEGLCDERMESAIPAIAHWRLSTLPRSLSNSQLKQVLTSFDTSTPCGHRDRAIVLCLASLGLRPGELAELRLEDFDWRRGTIESKTRKTRRGTILPLPDQAGRAIVAYLRDHRPPTAERRVFVKHVGHHRGEPISSHTISVLVGRVLRRAGVAAPMAGAYVFRHTLAGRLVRQGTSLKEVADFFGHRSLDTTAIYAKLDLPALYEVALPWPEVLQ